jgi:HEAT repeat protein
MRALVALVLSLAGCSSSPAMLAAARGDRAALAADVSAREKVGDVSTPEAVELARAVASREIRTASPADAVDRIRDAWPCARELDDALAARMETHDEAGAMAALARIDGRALDLDEARDYVADPEPHWRAVGVRALVRPEDRDARLRALSDPLPLVRRQAARASREARAPEDLGVLAEAARVDPEPIVRNDAVRSIAALPETPGGETARLLADLWAAGDAGLREDIALAWASANVWNAGGREQLRVLLAASHGSAVVEVAAAVLRRHEPEDGAAGRQQDELTEEASAQMIRAMDQGARATRLQAIAEAPLDRADLVEALRRASKEDDPELAVSALARLVEAKDAAAIARLEPLARPGSDVATRARFALASAGDRRIQAWIEADLGSSDANERLAAATALGSLGSPARAAPLLADPEPRVRVRAACTILMAGRVSR